MKRVVHLSDLHFGRDRPELLRPLLAAVNDIGPDLVAISGDLTQRATPGQFRAAAAFLRALDAPVLSVPGNHDVPLHNLFVRVFMPWRRYRHWIARDLEPQHQDDEIVVVGVNTVNPLVWQQGWFRPAAVNRVCKAFAAQRGENDDRVRIVVAHHPMEHLPGERKRLMRGAAGAVARLSECGADVVLSGHLHSWRAEPFAFVDGHSQALQVHAGTGLSTRLRGEVNDFNLLTLSAQRIVVARHAAGEGVADFAPVQERVFVNEAQGWHPAPTEPD